MTLEIKCDHVLDASARTNIQTQDRGQQSDVARSGYAWRGLYLPQVGDLRTACARAAPPPSPYQSGARVTLPPLRCCLPRTTVLIYGSILDRLQAYLAAGGRHFYPKKQIKLNARPVRPAGLIRDSEREEERGEGRHASANNEPRLHLIFILLKHLLIDPDVSLALVVR